MPPAWTLLINAGILPNPEPCTLIYLQKIVSCINLQLAIRVSKNHTFRTCTTRNQQSGRFWINRPIRYEITAKRSYFHKQPPDGRTDVAYAAYGNNTFFFGKKTKLHNI